MRTEQEWLAEAARYDRLAREGRNQVVAGAPPEYYDGQAQHARNMASAMKKAARVTYFLRRRD